MFASDSFTILLFLLTRNNVAYSQIKGTLQILMFRCGRLLRRYGTLTNELTFTDSFTKALNQKLAQKPVGQFLRLQVLAGEGCEGFSYKFRFDSQLIDTDLVKKLTEPNQLEEKVLFAVSSSDLQFLKGAELDYAAELVREIFYVKDNPNAELSCSCKTSFSPKESAM